MDEKIVPDKNIIVQITNKYHEKKLNILKQCVENIKKSAYNGEDNTHCCDLTTEHINLLKQKEYKIGVYDGYFYDKVVLQCYKNKHKISWN